MSTKLISMNMGVRLHVMVDGQERTIEWSAVCPSNDVPSPAIAISKLIEFVNENFGTDMFLGWDNVPQIRIARPAKIKAPKYVSQDKYNKIIRELGKD